MAKPDPLVAGLGNPGREYARTRHNAGFWFVDALAREARRVACARSRSSPASVAKAGDVRLVKPTTFMNLSGRTRRRRSRASIAIAPDEILVVHDELDLPAGRGEAQARRRHAGHNGLQDIRAQLGTADFWRLAHRHRPSARLGAHAAGSRRLRAEAAARGRRER